MGITAGAIRILTGAVFSSSLLIWSTSSQAWTSGEESACRADAFRLCTTAIPNVDRVTLCMINNLDQLSPRCRAYFKTEDDLKAEQAPKRER